MEAGFLENTLSVGQCDIVELIIGEDSLVQILILVPKTYRNSIC